MEKEEKLKQEKNPSFPVTVTALTKSASFLDSDGSKTETESFHTALTELKELRSQLQQAADYCEDAFLKAENKKLILDSTKNYLCDAIVAVIDHLGTVSSKIEQKLHDTSEITRTEQKMDFLKQRILTCQQFVVTVELSTIRSTENLTGHHRHYISRAGQRLEKYDSDLREEDSENFKGLQKNEQVGSTRHIRRQSSVKEIGMVVPGRDSPSVIMKSSFGLKDGRTHGGNSKKTTNLLSFLRISKRKTLASSNRVG